MAKSDGGEAMATIFGYLILAYLAIKFLPSMLSVLNTTAQAATKQQQSAGSKGGGSGSGSGGGSGMGGASGATNGAVGALFADLKQAFGAVQQEANSQAMDQVNLFQDNLNSTGGSYITLMNPDGTPQGAGPTLENGSYGSVQEINGYYWQGGIPLGRDASVTDAGGGGTDLGLGGTDNGSLIDVGSDDEGDF